MTSTRLRLLGAVGAGVMAVLLLAGPVAAQDGPYGSTTTTRPDGGPRPSCRLNPGAVAPGSSSSARVTAVPRGSTVRIFFAGEQVAEAEASGPGSSARVNVNVPYTVPEVDPGSYPVTAVGETFTAPCGEQRVEGESEVRGAQVPRGGGGSGSLPRTGLTVGLLLAVALALIVGGRALLEGARRRRQTAGLTRSGPADRRP
jgi:hypothetical protein